MTAGRAVAAQLERLAATCRDDPVARDDEREAAHGAERSRCPRGAWSPGERGEPTVGHDLTPADRSGGVEELVLKQA